MRGWRGCTVNSLRTASSPQTLTELPFSTSIAVPIGTEGSVLISKLAVIDSLCKQRKLRGNYENFLFYQHIEVNGDVIFGPYLAWLAHNKQTS